MNLSQEFSGQSVLITGGSSGIGEATAGAFLAAGARVFLLGRSRERLDAAVRRLTTGGMSPEVVVADVSRPADCRRAVAEVADATGGLDILVNSAGVYAEGPADGTDEETWDTVMNTNLKGTFFMIRYAIPVLERSGGCVVNVGSDSGLVGNDGASVYCASKGGVTLLTRSLAVELIRRGIRVNAVCPGIVETPMVSEDFRRSAFTSREEYDRQNLIPYPEGIERFVRPEEVAGSILFLASRDRASVINGACLSVDFGLTAGY